MDKDKLTMKTSLLQVIDDLENIEEIIMLVRSNDKKAIPMFFGNHYTLFGMVEELRRHLLQGISPTPVIKVNPSRIAKPGPGAILRGGN